MSVDENKQNKKGGMVGYLFGGIFLLAGLAVMFFVAVVPIGKYMESGSWARVPATVLSSKLNSHRSDGSTTYSVSGSYRYHYRGVDYTSSQISQYSGSDNFGDYWQQLYRRIDSARRNNRTVSAWANPDAPHEAYLDRTFRWGSVIFGFTFGGVFALVGGGVMFLMRRGSKEAALVSETGFYSSQEKSGHWFLLGFGAIFILLPSPAYLEILDKVRAGDYLILVVLLFPLAGAGIALAGWKMRQNYRFFGPTPLRIDPQPGHAGGQVGGAVHVGVALPEEVQVEVWLSCVRCYYSGSGEDRSVREDVRWQANQHAWCRPSQKGTEIQFCFDAPQDQPATRDRERRVSGRQDWIRWRVTLETQAHGRELKRSWEIPVIKGSDKSRYQLPQAHVVADQRDRNREALESAGNQIEVKQTGQGLYLESRVGRNLAMTFGLLVFGLIFAGIGTGMLLFAASESFILYPMGGIFSLVGYPLLLSALFMLGRSLQVWIRAGEVRMVRRWMGVPVYRRQCRLLSADQLALGTGMSSTSNGRKTEYLHVYVKDEKNKVRLAEGVRGRAEAEALREMLVRLLRLA